MLHVEGPVAVRDRRLELSGCAAVSGGVLVVEDEVVGTVLHLNTPSGDAPEVTHIKLERKKKQRAPYAPRPKLFPIQDFEDIASDRDGDVYLIGSHNGKEGERRPDREFLLHAEWDRESAELKVIGEQYALLDSLAPVLDRLGCGIGLTATEVSDALNIEGLAYNAGTLYIGLRSPLSADGKAIVVAASARALFDGDSPIPLDPIELDLSGGGIRALDWDSKSNMLLAISGPPIDGATAEAALWHVDTSKADATPLHTFSAEHARKQPEGVCRLSEADGAGLLVVLDGNASITGGGAELLTLTE